MRIAADTTTPEGAALAIAACQKALGAAPTLLAHCVGSTLIAPLHRTRLDADREVARVNAVAPGHDRDADDGRHAEDIRHA